MHINPVGQKMCLLIPVDYYPCSSLGKIFGCGLPLPPSQGWEKITGPSHPDAFVS